MRGRKEQPKKPRTEYLYGSTVGDVSELTITVDQRTGAMTFGKEMTNVYLEKSYDRSKGPKAVYRIPQVNVDMTFDPEKALVKNFDFLCAIDTNTRIIKNEPVSVAGVVTFREAVIPGANGLQRYWQFGAPFLVEFVGVRHEKPENLAWVYVLQRFWEQGTIDGRKRAGIVVDSDLGNINDYNHRRKPVFETIHLPPNTQLIYASADTGKDSIVNKALSIADSAASQMLDAIDKGLFPFNNEVVPSPWYEGVRIITPDIVTD